MQARLVNRALRARSFWSGARTEPDLLALLDLVALGTVADVARLEGLNRAFVAKGLLAMRRRERVGLTALMDVARLSGPPEPWHLGFMLGPRINAGGRAIILHRCRAPFRKSLICCGVEVESGWPAIDIFQSVFAFNISTILSGVDLDSSLILSESKCTP